jgi:DNA helicase IV
LERNFRQREALALLSAGFRYVLQGDERVEFKANEKSAAFLHSYASRDEMVAFILDRIWSVNEYATVAVIVPTEREARDWYDLLSQDLTTGLRPALLSRREDLTRRFEIHFTEVYETKGLEFDVVIVPDLSSFELNNEIGRNQAYVAITRPKHSLLLGCDVRALNVPAISTLIDHKLIKEQPLA